METTKVRISNVESVSFNEKETIFEEVATRARSIDFMSALYYLPNPDPVLKKSGKDIRVYNDLLVDPSVSAAVASFKDGVQELEWDIDRGQAKTQQANTIKKILLDLDARDERGGIGRIIGEILDARLFGYQPCEVMWESVGRMIVPVNIIAKPQEWFHFDQDNKLLLRTSDSLAGEPVPDYKFICPTYEGRFNNPYGRPVLSSCFWPVTFKKGGLKFFVQFAEKYGMPYIVGKHRYQKEDDVTKFLADLDDMVQDGVIAIGKDQQEVEVHQTGSANSSDIHRDLVSIMREEITYAILNHNAGTSSTPGRLGNEDGAMTARASVINSGKKLVQQAFNVLIKWTYDLNGMTGDIPRFVFFEEEDVDMATADRDSKLQGIGVQFTKSYFMRTYGLNEDDFEITQPAQGVAAEFAEEDVSEDQALVNEIGDGMHERGRNAVESGLVKPVLDYIEKATSYEDALSELADIFPTMPIDQLQRHLTKAHAAAHAIGRAHAAK